MSRLLCILAAIALTSCAIDSDGFRDGSYYYHYDATYAPVLAQMAGGPQNPGLK